MITMKSGDNVLAMLTGNTTNTLSAAIHLARELRATTIEIGDTVIDVVDYDDIPF